MKLVQKVEKIEIQPSEFRAFCNVMELARVKIQDAEEKEQITLSLGKSIHDKTATALGLTSHELLHVKSFLEEGFNLINEAQQ